MKMLHNIIFYPCVCFTGFMFLILQVFTTGAVGCDLAAVNQCVSLLNSSTTADVLNEGISSIPPSEVLVKLCRVREEYKTCFDPLAAECTNNPVFSMTFGIIDKTLTYLCLDGYTEILQHESCWNKTGVTEGTLVCHQHQNTMIAYIKQQANVMDTGDLRNNWCSILENTSDCMTDVVAEMCGPTPACIMQTMMTRALAGLADLMTCSLLSDCSYLAPFTNESTGPVSTQEQLINQSDSSTAHSRPITNENSTFIIPSTSSNDVTVGWTNGESGNSDSINNSPGNAAVRGEYLSFSTFICLSVLLHLS